MQALKHAIEAVASTLSHSSSNNNEETSKFQSTISDNENQLKDVPSKIEKNKIINNESKQFETSNSSIGNTSTTTSSDTSSSSSSSSSSSNKEKSKELLSNISKKITGKKEEPICARALILGFGKANRNVFGHVVFYQETTNGPTAIYGSIQGLPVGQHGMIIHEFGDITDGLESAGNHFNPLKNPHGALNDDFDNRHIGDLGNIMVNEHGVASFHMKAKSNFVPLIGENSVVARSIVIHSLPDDYGKLECTTSTPGSHCSKKGNEKKCGQECQGRCLECKACNSYLNGNVGFELALGTIAIASTNYCEKNLNVNFQSILNLDHFNQIQLLISTTSNLKSDFDEKEMKGNSEKKNLLLKKVLKN